MFFYFLKIKLGQINRVVSFCLRGEHILLRRVGGNATRLLAFTPDGTRLLAATYSSVFRYLVFINIFIACLIWLFSFELGILKD